MAQGALYSRWVMVNGVRTHYSEAGTDGPEILAIHGGGHGASAESSMGLLMQAMAGDFRVVAPDSIGGYGLTDVNAPTPRGLLDRSDHALAFADALCLDRFTVVGNSQGAYSAAKLAYDHPERVDKLVLIGSLTIAQCMGIDQPMTPGFKALVDYDGTPKAMRRLLEGLVENRSKITDELVERRQASALRPGAMEALDRFMQATAGLKKNPILAMHLDWRDMLPKLTAHIPTIFFWGEKDTFALPETGKAIEPLLPDVTFHWLERAGHQVQLDEPEICAQIIREFVLGK